MINRFASSTPRSEKSVSFIDSEDSMESQYSEVFNSTPISNNINNNINNNNNNNNNNNTPYRRVTRAQKASLKQKDLLLDEISYEDSQKEDDSQQPILNYQQKKKPRQIHNRVIPTRELIFSSKSGENFKNQKIYLNQKLPQYVAVHQDQVIPLRKSVYRYFKTQHNFSEFLKKPDISDLIFQKHFLLTLRDPNFLVKKWALEKLLIRTFVSKKPMQISLDFQIQNSLANLFSLLWIFLIKNEEKFKEEEIFILGEENDRNIFSKLQKEIFKDNNNNQDNINNENENKNQENKDEKNEIEDNEIQNNSEKRHLKKIKIEKSQTQIEEEIIKDESDIEIGQYNQFNNYNENIENNIEESNQNFDENNNENDENNNENDKNNNENDKNNDENNDNNKNNKNIENELFNNPQIQLDNQIREEQKMKGEQYREYSKIMQKKFHKENFENLTPSLTLEILKLLTTIIHNFSLNPPHYWLLNHEILFPGIIEIFCCQDISLARLGLDILNTISWEIVLEKKNEKILGFLYSFLYLGEIRDYSLVILSLSVLQKLARPENYIFFSRFESKFYERLADLLLIFFMEDQNQKQEKLREILNQKETEKETQQNDNQNQNNNQKENKKESEKENKKESEKENKKESEKENKKESEKEEKSTNKNKKKKTKKKKNEEEPLGKKENPIPILINLFLSFLQISPEVISSISKIENIVPLFVDISVLLRNEIEVEFYEKILIILNIILTKENSSYLKKFQFHFIELSCTQKKEEKMIAHLAAQILEHLFFVNQDFVE